MRVLRLFGAASALVPGQTLSAAHAPSATIANGTVNGVHNGHFNQDFFLGIPFANAPRLDNPTIWDKKFDGPWNATHYGPTCYGFGSNQLLPLTQSEDCLNLNVIRPSGYEQHSLPVLVWIYGGGWSQGATADPMWNLSYIVDQSVKQNQPIMAVSINYRLSFLGFPGGQEAWDAGVTNLAFKDQRVGLQWIQENIAAFGGDPRQVTAWGESAGGASTAMHLIANGGKGSAGLFRSAILVSGFTTGINPVYPNKTQTGYDAIVENAGCSTAANTLQCLRAAPFDKIYNVENKTGWGPSLDGDFIARPPALELEAGRVHRVPILLGGNSDEGLFVTNLLQYFPNTTAELSALLEKTFPALSNATYKQLLDAYPVNGPAPPYSLPPDYPWCDAMHAAKLSCSAQYRRQSGLLGDYFSGAPRRFMAQQWAKLGLPTYAFLFDTNPTAIPIVYWNNLGPGFALHGAELAYEFGLPPGFTTPIDFYPPVKPVATHATLSRNMISRWISFAHGTDPNSYKDYQMPSWPDYRTAAQIYVFNATDHLLNIHVAKDDYREGPINVWNDNVFAVNYGNAGS